MHVEREFGSWGGYNWCDEEWDYGGEGRGEGRERRTDNGGDSEAGHIFRLCLLLVNEYYE